MGAATASGAIAAAAWHSLQLPDTTSSWLTRPGNGAQAVVEWQASQTFDVCGWVTDLPDARLPLWQSKHAFIICAWSTAAAATGAQVAGSVA